MSTVKDLLSRKGSGVHTIEVDKTVFDAVEKMTACNVGALVITHLEEGKPKVCGIISERDYLRHVVLKGRTSRSTPISDIMTKKVIYGEPSSTAEEVLGIMTEKRVRHLPIMENEELVGILSIGDCVKAIIAKQEVEIKYLKEYIADGYPGPAGESNSQ